MTFLSVIKTTISTISHENRKQTLFIHTTPLQDYPPWHLARNNCLYSVARCHVIHSWPLLAASCNDHRCYYALCTATKSSHRHRNAEDWTMIAAAHRLNYILSCLVHQMIQLGSTIVCLFSVSSHLVITLHRRNVWLLMSLLLVR